MKQDSSLVKNHSHDNITQVAWLYHVSNLSQQEIGDRLGISRFKVVRMLAEAKQLGVVRIVIEHNSTTTLELADQLTKRFHLREAQVARAPKNGSDTEARRAVGIAAAGFLARIALAKQPITVGLG